MKTNKLIKTCYLILFLLYAMAIGAGFFAPYAYDEQNREHPYQPPNILRFDLSKQKFYFYPLVLKDKALKKYEPDKTKKIILGSNSDEKFFLLGTDMHGRDIFSRLIRASRISLSIGLIGVSITFIIGMFIGGLSGYFGGKTDNIIMRLCEIIMCFPFFYLMLALRALLPITLSSYHVYICIIVIMSLIGWPAFARVIRGMVLSIKNMDYISSAKVLGVGHIRIICRHILPNTFSYAIVAAFLNIPSYIIGEAGLSFIGLGIQDPDPSWGNMLACAMNVRVLTSFPWVLAPGVMIFITVICFYLIGDHLRDRVDPKHKYMR